MTPGGTSWGSTDVTRDPRGPMARTRLLLVASALATIVAIVTLVGYAWSALDRASRDADEAQAQLALMRAIEKAEEHLHDIAAGEVASAGTAGDEKLTALMAELSAAQWTDPSDRKLVGRLDALLAPERAPDPSDRRWAEAGQLLSRLGKRAVVRSQDLVEETSEPARARSYRVLRIGAGTVLLFAIFAAVLYLRLRQRQREAVEALRRQDRLAALGVLAASVAHEINNPLATIGVCADALSRRTEGHPEREVFAEYVDTISEETRRCSGIVGGLRDLSRDGPPATTQSDLARLAREVVALLQMGREEGAAAIEVEGRQTLELMCDPDKIKQLLLNLVLNARDACDVGGRVVLRVSRDADDAALLEVSDDGCGIDRKELPHVFEPFRTNKARGLGIGLFLCERIATQHGGTISAASEGPGRGATFTVRLPTHTAAGV